MANSEDMTGRQQRCAGASPLPRLPRLRGVLAALLVAGCAGDGALQQLHLAETPADAATASAGIAPSPASVANGASLTPRRAEAALRRSETKDGARIVATNTPADDDNFSLARLQRRIDEIFTPKGPPVAERQRLGDTLARKVLSGARLSDDMALKRRLERIVRRLTRAARKDSAFPARWRVYVLDTDRADAFTSGGGHLFITRGMVELLGTDERIATVLAHEMAHNLQAHVWAAREKKELARRANRFSREVLAEQMNMPWLGRSVAFLVRTSLNTYSRQQEYDADAAGLDLLVAAGYPPRAALDTFDLLRRHFRERGSVQNFFRSHHPLYERRRWYLDKRIRAHYRQQAGLPPVRRSNWRQRETR